MSSTILVSSTGNADVSGRSTQAHVIYATGSARWWAFYLSSATVLSALYSADGLSWTTSGTTLTVPSGGQEGYSWSVAYARISSTDVVHLQVEDVSGTNGSKHFRATISGTTLTWDAGVLVGSTLAISGFTPSPVTALDSGATVWIGDSGISIGGALGNMEAFSSSGADTGGSFTESFSGGTTVWSATSNVSATWLGAGTSAAMLEISDNCPTSGTMSDLEYSWFNGTSWAAAAGVGFSLGANQDARDWGACARTTTDFHAVVRTNTGLAHRRYNGSTWSAGDTIPAETSKAANGVALTTDGTSVWCFVIDNGAANAIKYSQWQSGTGWGAWTTLEGTTQTRLNISVCPQVSTPNAIQVLWTEGTSLVGEQLSLGGGGGAVTPAAPASAHGEWPVAPLRQTQRIALTTKSHDLTSISENDATYGALVQFYGEPAPPIMPLGRGEGMAPLRQTQRVALTWRVHNSGTGIAENDLTTSNIGQFYGVPNQPQALGANGAPALGVQANAVLSEPLAQIIEASTAVQANAVLSEPLAQVVEPSAPLVAQAVLSEPLAQIVEATAAVAVNAALIETSAQIIATGQVLQANAALSESSAQLVAAGQVVQANVVLSEPLAQIVEAPPAAVQANAVLSMPAALVLNPAAPLVAQAALSEPSAILIATGQVLQANAVLSGTGGIASSNVPGTCTVTDVLLGTYTATVADAPLGIYTATVTDVLLSTYTATVTDASPTYTATVTDVLLPTYTATVADAI